MPKILQGLSRGVRSCCCWCSLLALLRATRVIAFCGVGVELSNAGRVAALYLGGACQGGVFFSLVVGIGLMALVFFSARSGYDESAAAWRRPDDRHQEVRRDLHQAAPCAGPLRFVG